MVLVELACELCVEKKSLTSCGSVFLGKVNGNIVLMCAAFDGDFEVVRVPSLPVKFCSKMPKIFCKNSDQGRNKQ